MYSFPNLIFLLCNIIWIIIYIRLVLMDPGIIPKNSVSQEEMLDAFKQDKSSQYCITCRCKKPTRAKHCRTCNQCVARFDHYCPWINNDVGFYNHRLFLLVLIGVCINHSCYLYFCYSYLSIHFPNVSYFSLIPALYDQHTLIFELFLYHIFFFIVNWYNCIFTIITIISNLTTNENFNQKRYKYLWNGSQFNNRFNKGFLGNLYEFLFSVVDYTKTFDSDIIDF